MRGAGSDGGRALYSRSSMSGPERLLCEWKRSLAREPDTGPDGGATETFHISVAPPKGNATRGNASARDELPFSLAGRVGREWYLFLGEPSEAATAHAGSLVDALSRARGSEAPEWDARVAARENLPGGETSLLFRVHPFYARLPSASRSVGAACFDDGIVDSVRYAGPMGDTAGTFVGEEPVVPRGSEREPGHGSGYEPGCPRSANARPPSAASDRPDPPDECHRSRPVESDRGSRAAGTSRGGARCDIASGTRGTRSVGEAPTREDRPAASRPVRSERCLLTGHESRTVGTVCDGGVSPRTTHPHPPDRRGETDALPGWDAVLSACRAIVEPQAFELPLL